MGITMDIQKFMPTYLIMYEVLQVVFLQIEQQLNTKMSELTLGDGHSNLTPTSFFTILLLAIIITIVVTIIIIEYHYF